jgi:hypothetical protein
MYRRMEVGIWYRLLKGTAPAVMAVVLGWSAVAPAQTQTSAPKAIPDAQVEANVLKALAGAPDLANQAITTTTVYGVVTLSGSVQTEALRTEAETIASRTSGVQKVVDEMTLGGQTADAQPMQDPGPQGADAQDTDPNPTDANMADPQGQAPVVQESPNSNNAQPPSQSPNQASGPYYGPGAPEYRQPYGGQHAPPPPDYSQQGYPPQQQGYPQQQQGYPQQQQGYPPQRGYNGPPQPIYGGQEAGQAVTIEAGALVRIRINQTLESGRTQPGTRFDGVVVNDVVAGGAVAIPRGATVQGTVVDAKASGALAGRGELSLQLTQVTLGGRIFPIVSDVWAQNGGDKTVHSVNSTIVGGGIGALFGAAVGGGEGAAIGAGVGGALGLGASAASHSGQVYIPSEGMLTFHLAQPATVATVSQQEMDRLAQGVPRGGEPQRLQRRYPTVYYGPGYYRPYPYPYPYPY